MVRGTVITHRRRCGKPNCRCANGESLHEAAVLSYSQDGRTKFVMLKASEVESVPRRDGALQSREIPVGGGGERRPRGAGRPSRASRQDELSNAPAISEQADGFERSDTVYLALVGFLRGEEARRSLMRSWRPRSGRWGASSNVSCCRTTLTCAP